MEGNYLIHFLIIKEKICTRVFKTFTIKCYKVQEKVFNSMHSFLIFKRKNKKFPTKNIWAL